VLASPSLREAMRARCLAIVRNGEAEVVNGDVKCRVVNGEW
jgi:hypothetical protein